MKAVGFYCNVMADGTVEPFPGYEGTYTELRGFKGPCQFDVIDARGGQPAQVHARRTSRPPTETGPALPSWVPSIDSISLAPIIGWGALPSLAHASQIVYDISAEPGFPELYDPTYGWGHSYWLVIDIDGVDVPVGAVLAGAHGVISPVSVDYYAGVTITTRARLYSSNGGRLLDTETYPLTPS